MFYKIGILIEQIRKIHKRTPVLDSISLSNKVTSCNVIKKRLQHSCFPVNFCESLRKPFFVEHLRWLLLDVYAKAKNSPSLVFERFVFTLPSSKLAYVIKRLLSLTTLRINRFNRFNRFNRMLLRQ